MERSYTPEEVAEHITREKENDKFAKHVGENGRQDFANCGKGGIEEIETREEYARVIRETMTHPDTECFKGVNWDMYYHHDTNMFVGVERDNPENSTAYPPRQEDKYWKGEQKKDNDKRKELDLPPLELHRGGINRLYPEREHEQTKDLSQDSEYARRLEQFNERWAKIEQAREKDRGRDDHDHDRER